MQVLREQPQNQTELTQTINDLFNLGLSDFEVVVMVLGIIFTAILVWIIRMNSKGKSRIKKDGNVVVTRDHISPSRSKKNKREVHKSFPTKPLKKEKRRTGVAEEINTVKKESLEKREKEKEFDDSSKSNTSKHKDVLNEEGKVYSIKPEVKAKKPEKPSKPVSKVRENTSKEDEILRIGYTPTKDFEQDIDWKYPVVKMPKENSVIRQPYHRRQQVRGYKEKAFQETLKNALKKSIEVLGDCVISTGSQTRPFEPDITLRRLKNSRNIFIDIEIDEPYGGISRSATHVKGEDDHRDIYFNDRGWIVIRFAEIQVHKEVKECVAYVLKVIQKIAPEILIPQSILNSENPTPIPQWDQIQAEKWEKEKYREVYLNHEFHLDEERNGDAAIEFSELDKKTEELVESSTYVDETPDPVRGEINFNKVFKRDKRIEFFPESHLYLIDGVPAKSVSEVVGKFFPAFDKERVAKLVAKKRQSTPEKIIAQFEKQRDLGTDLHLQIENYFNGEDYDEPEEFEYFLNFIDDHDHLDTFRTEWRVFDESKLIAGTIDYVSKNSDGTYSIYDWKRSKNVVDSYNGGGPKREHPFGNGFGPLRHIDDTSYNKYCLQQGIYRRILEKHYDIEITDMFLVVIHPNYSDYYKFRVDEYQSEVDYILKNV